MAADGVREVTLLGQNVNSYGRDLAPRASGRASPSCSALLDAVEGIERIRYTSPHPKDMREDVIRAHAELASVCEHIHLPLQSGSSRILKAMRRTYDRERYLDRVALIREHVPDASLTTDIIVGFPGETEEDFARDARGRRARSATTAPSRSSSRRGAGTEAAELTEGLVPHPVKVERMERLLEVVQRRAPRARPALRRAHARGAGGRALAHRSRAPARPHAPQQGRELQRAGAPGRADRRARSPPPPARRCRGGTSAGAGSGRSA